MVQTPPLLTAFTVHPIPKAPLHLGTNLTLRSVYYEPFLISSAFTGSACLLWALEYAIGLRMALHKIDPKAIQLFIFAMMSIPFQFCILDFPFADYRVFLIPFLTLGVFAVAFAYIHHHAHGQGQYATRRSLCRSDRFCLLSGASAACDLNSNFNPILSSYRVSLYIATTLCIFSRDLPCWNLRLSKSKAFGTGVMDMGIGCFVLCLGAVGPTAIRPVHQIIRSTVLQRCIRQCALLALIGIVMSFHRMWRIGFKIPQDPTRFPAEWREYGVHWNAFYSLAVARLLGTCLELLLLPKRCPPLLAAAAMAAAHEYLLSLGLAQIVLAPGLPEPHNRFNLIGQNREGLASIPGLLTLYLAGLQIGRWAQDWTVAEERGAARRATAKFLALLIGSLAWRPLVLESGGSLLPESRRLLSPAYTACVLAFTCQSMLWLRVLFELRRRLSISNGCLLQLGHLASLDRAGLASFLLGNLFTGLFNGALDAFGVNREVMIGCEMQCFYLALSYSTLVQWTSLTAVEVLTQWRTRTRRRSRIIGSFV